MSVRDNYRILIKKNTNNNQHFSKKKTMNCQLIIRKMINLFLFLLIGKSINLLTYATILDHISSDPSPLFPSSIDWNQLQADNKPCSTLRVRRNILSLTHRQLTDYINGVKKLYNDGTIDLFASIHRTNYYATHNQPQIFWWHRYFIWKFENELKRINPELTIPYWDASEQADEPHRSVVLSNWYFGGNGDSINYCVTNSFLRSMRTKQPDGISKCIKRDYYGSVKGTLGPWNNTRKIVDIINTSENSESFRVKIEDSIHLDVHKGLGGIKANGVMNSPLSPLDPIFFLHHSNLDRWLYTWQLSSPERFDMLDGFQHLEDGTEFPLTKNNELDGYPNVTLGSIINIQENPLCYTYDYLPLNKLYSKP